MTTEEKLEHFQDICTQDAKARSDKLVDDHKKALEAAYEQHVAHAKNQARMQITAETEKLEKELNKKRSAEELNRKREFSRCQEEYKEKLFAELKDRIAGFMKTEEYVQLLESQIEAAVNYAGKDELIVYLDPADEGLAAQITEKYSVNLKMSDASFGGGTRAILPQRHVLIDNSFDAKMDEARHEFTFDLGGR